MSERILMAADLTEIEHRFDLRTSSDGFEGPDAMRLVVRTLLASHRALGMAWEGSRARVAVLEESVRQAQALAAEQAEDEGLWSMAIPPRIGEAYIQQELRRLTALVEAIPVSSSSPAGFATARQVMGT